MINNNSKKGLGMPLMISIIALAFVVTGIAYYAIQKQSKEAGELQKKALMEKGAMEKNEDMAMMKKAEIHLELKSQNNSGQKGNAVISDAGGKTKVVLTLSETPTSLSQPAHIHLGSCAAIGTVKYPLTNAVNSLSETVLDVSFDALVNQLPLSLNVHKSAAEANKYVACGDITKESIMMMEEEKGTMMKKESETMSAEGGSASGGMAKYTGTVLAGKSAPLLDFTKADYDTAMKSDKLIVLYFYANWCPICKVEFPIAQAAFNELTTDKAVGFRVNYNDNDTDADEIALARQFGVVYQHTKVFLRNGKQILKAPDSWDDKRYDIEINKAINQ